MNDTPMRKIYLINSSILAIMLLLSVPVVRHAEASDPPILYLFWGEGCPHCEKEKTFLKELHKDYPQLEMRWFEVLEHPEYRKLVDSVMGNDILTI